MKSSTELFTECWHTDGPRVLAFARRHVGDDHAHDVVSETFMIAWRRWDKVSEPPIGWLILTAKGVIRNRLRTNRRQSALADRITLLGQVAAPDISDAAIGRHEALTRLAALTEEHREAILLTSWDGLTSEEAAEALGIRAATFRRRLSRARVAIAEGSPPADSYRTPQSAATKETP